MNNRQKWLVTFLDQKGGTAISQEGTEDDVVDGFLDYCTNEGLEPEAFRSPDGKKILLRVNDQPFALIEKIDIQ